MQPRPPGAWGRSSRTVRRGSLTVVLLVAGLLAACGSADTAGTKGSAAPASSAPPATTAAVPGAGTLSNCGTEVTVATPPQRAVTMNQGATEVLLALGLQGQMIGTAYLDDQVAPAYAAGYAAVPVLSKEYPSKEALLAEQPDFVYASYASAFEPEAAGDRAALQGIGIGSYVSPFACADTALRPGKVTAAGVFGEIADIGKVFGVSEIADKLIADQRAQLETATSDRAGAGLKVLWWDSGTRAPFVGACCGGPAMIMDSVGATNAFADLEGSWENVDWEKVVAADPDVVVLVDATWDSAESKLAYVARTPALHHLRAFREHHTVQVPFSDTSPGVRVVTGIQVVADGLRTLGVVPTP